MVGKPVVDPLKEIYKITVKQEGKADIILECPGIDLIVFEICCTDSIY
jgi:hypothetical protein